MPLEGLWAFIKEYVTQKCHILEITDIKCRLLSKHLFQRTQRHG